VRLLHAAQARLAGDREERHLEAALFSVQLFDLERQRTDWCAALRHWHAVVQRLPVLVVAI
jgi:hypothetical protein